MPEPMSVDRVYELLVEAEGNGLSGIDTARLIAEASETGGPGPKPDDYLCISLNIDGHVDITLDTHYVNHGGTWTSTGPVAHVRKELPEPKWSQFVCVELSELGLTRKDNHD